MTKNKLDFIQPVMQFTDCSDLFSFTRFATTRHGGVSEGEYASFNLGSNCNDNPDHVARNREVLCETLGVEPDFLFVPNQTHGDAICIIDADFLGQDPSDQQERLRAIDAIITPLDNVGIGITTADCVPLVFYCLQSAVIAVAHAGWRGSSKKIADKVVKRMQEDYNCVPADIYATIFPCINRNVYEVGEEVISALAKTGIDLKEATECGNHLGHFFLDLVSVNRQQLLASGLLPEHIEELSDCTYTWDEDFFSARRQGIDSGRMLSGIVMKRR